MIPPSINLQYILSGFLPLEQRRYMYLFKEPRNRFRQPMKPDAGRYDNPIPTRFRIFFYFRTIRFSIVELHFCAIGQIDSLTQENCWIIDFRTEEFYFRTIDYQNHKNYWCPPLQFTTNLKILYLILGREKWSKTLNIFSTPVGIIFIFPKVIASRYSGMGGAGAFAIMSNRSLGVSFHYTSLFGKARIRAVSPPPPPRIPFLIVNIMEQENNACLFTDRRWLQMSSLRKCFL